MSDEIRHEMTGLLAAQVDSFAEVIEQRDLARSVAVGLEGELAAVTIERDALIAQLHRAEAGVLSEVRAERQRQDEKWGEQNHVDVDPVLMNRKGGCTPQRMAEEYDIPTANRAQWACENRFRRGDGAWADILIEEVAEAVEAAVIAPDDLRAELVQIAAVAVAWAEAIDRRAGTS